MMRLQRWMAQAGCLVVVEVGAGTALPTIRRFSERHGPRVVRINARESQIDQAIGIGIAGGALDTLRAIDAVIGA